MTTLMHCSTIPLVVHYSACKVVHRKSHHRYVPHSVATQTSYDTECNSSVFITIFRNVVFMFNYFWKGVCVCVCVCVCVGAHEEVRDKKKGK